MYRDSVNRPDDHDRAVGAIQIADGLIAECTSFVSLLRGPEKPERWGAARALTDDYPEIWTHLDGARRVLAARGVNTTGYDELRRQVNPLLAVTHVDGSHVVDAVALEDARRALAELRLAMPGADWRAIDARSTGLAGTPLKRRGQRLGVACLIGAFVLAIGAWTTAIVPRRKPDPAMLMQRELASVVTDRQDRIEELQRAIGDRCDRPKVLELMRLFVMDGRFEDANAYADRYEAACGEDAAVRRWGDAPKPKPRD